MYDSLSTPAYVLQEACLARNLAVLDDVQRRAGCEVLLALKAFATPQVFPVLRDVLAGTAASSLHEARLGREHFGDSVHLCAPAYRPAEFPELLSLARHVVFNSFGQWRRWRAAVAASPRRISCGMRINPEHSEVAAEIYDPCAPGSRLGVTREHFDEGALNGIEGLHFHTLCGVNADALQRTLAVIEEKFGDVLGAMRWINFGGGHHITREDYDRDLLVELIAGVRERYGVQVFLEPGEAVVLNAGVLVGQVLDLLPNATAVLDVSATCHMPDVLEQPYRPDIAGAGAPGVFAHTYRLAGPTCLAGDVIGDYSFPAPLAVGQRVVFEDMACYTMVKNTMFNGVNLPDICIETAGGGIERVRRFGYQDYLSRLG